MVEFDGRLHNDNNPPISNTGGSMDGMTHAPRRLQSSIVLVLDESCQDRHYANPRMQNGVEGLHQSSPPDGMLSKSDIDILLTMFDKGAQYLSISANISYSDNNRLHLALSISPDIQ